MADRLKRGLGWALLVGGTLVIGNGLRAQGPGPGPESSATITPQTRQELFAAEAGGGEEPGMGPTPLDKVGILQGLLFGDNADDAKLKVAGWADFDYTYRSTGGGVNNVAPVMNRFGNEALARDIGIYLYKPLEKDWSWGFNSIFISGADASFLQPTAGGWNNSDPRFGTSFTDLNLTAHMPILTDGGIDIKAGRQTTVLGPQGALPWQRYFDSSDYAWYNMEEGRYTGVSAVWHVSKQFDWYTGVEIGGWGVFFDTPSDKPSIITQLSYWLDEEAKYAKVWTTVLTGSTSFFSPNKNTTVLELGAQVNWTDRIYQIVDTQMVWSKAPIFFPAPPGYQERAYDVYTYLGYHLTEKWDVNSRAEWYRDQDGGSYPGGFGFPKTDYYEGTVGLDYHPVSWLQCRPEIRYDHATNPRFGRNLDHQDQLSIAGDVLFKF